jgi:hypothetical protein
LHIYFFYTASSLFLFWRGQNPPRFPDIHFPSPTEDRTISFLIAISMILLKFLLDISPLSEKDLPLNHCITFHYSIPAASILSRILSISRFLLPSFPCLDSSSYILCEVQEQHSIPPVFRLQPTFTRTHHFPAFAFRADGETIQLTAG